MVTSLEIVEFDKQAFSPEPKCSERRVFNLMHLILHLSVLLNTLSYDTNRYNTTNKHKSITGMDDMITMSVRLPKKGVIWLRKGSAMATIEQHKRVSMNSLISQILTRAMEADRRLATRFVGSGKKIEAQKEKND